MSNPFSLSGKIALVTGAAQGIGRALAVEAKRRGAKAVVAADLDLAGAQETAKMIGGRAFKCDVGREDDIVAMVEAVEKDIGPIGLFCSNAGIGGFGGDPMNVASAPNNAWEKAWAVNVMSHVYAARVLVPKMITRGGGYFLNTVSAAGFTAAALDIEAEPARLVTAHFGLRRLAENFTDSIK